MVLAVAVYIRTVNRRIGGLEKTLTVTANTDLVNRRIGGLEILSEGDFVA